MTNLLTLSPQFQRTDSGLNKAIAVKSLSAKQLAGRAAKTSPSPQARKIFLIGADVTSNPRPYAKTLPDRGFVYQPNPIQGHQPIAIGHPYAFGAFLPERAKTKTGPWVVPLAMKRVTSQENKEMLGARQVRASLKDAELPFGKAFCVEVGDSADSKAAYLNANRDQENRVTIARARGTHTFYREPALEAETKAEKGHPTGYGIPFCLKAG